MIRISSIISPPYPTENDNIFESEYRFLVMNSSDGVNLNKRNEYMYCKIHWISTYELEWRSGNAFHL